jgi:hypothetical protein
MAVNVCVPPTLVALQGIEGLAGRNGTPFPLERAPDLQGEERVSTGGGVQLNERRTRKRKGEAPVQKTVECA